MKAVERAIYDLVIANRIVAHEQVVDAYGHVAVRHPERPDRFLLARSLAPGLVMPEDIVEFDLTGAPQNGDERPLYIERFIHAAIFEARPEVTATIHAHAEDILPFGVVRSSPLRAVIRSASFITAPVPVWDIGEHFGDTDILVRNLDQGRSLARALGNNTAALMSMHGFAAGARSLIEVVQASVNLTRNARAVLRATQLGGEIRYLTEGELAAAQAAYRPLSPETSRSWEYWAKAAGAGDLL